MGNPSFNCGKDRFQSSKSLRQACCGKYIVMMSIKRSKNNGNWFHVYLINLKTGLNCFTSTDILIQLTYNQTHFIGIIFDAFCQFLLLIQSFPQCSFWFYTFSDLYYASISWINWSNFQILRITQLKLQEFYSFKKYSNHRNSR